MNHLQQYILDCNIITLCQSFPEDGLLWGKKGRKNVEIEIKYFAVITFLLYCMDLREETFREKYPTYTFGSRNHRPRTRGEYRSTFLRAKNIGRHIHRLNCTRKNTIDRLQNAANLPGQIDRSVDQTNILLD